MADVVIVGGGVIGLTMAWELAEQGVAVCLVEQGQLGQEASWAGAGILPPGNPQFAKTPEAHLRAASHVLWPGYSAKLKNETGIDIGFRHCGGIEVRRSVARDELHDEIAAWRNEGVAVEPLGSEDARRLEPNLHSETTAAYRLPELCQVRNPRHLKALVAICAQRGVELRTGTPVVGFARQGERVIAVRTPSGEIPAGQVVVAGGAWSRQLLAQVGCELPVEPVRGQIVLLAAQPLPFRHVIQHGPRYLVPRSDGRILIGATEEHVGFEKQNTAEAVGGLIRFATGLVPCLSAAKFERAWCGLRPGSRDGLPYLGAVPGMRNLFAAAGHFRAGLQLSPITGVLMRQHLLGQPTTIPLEPYACDRHRSESDAG